MMRLKFTLFILGFAVLTNHVSLPRAVAKPRAKTKIRRVAPKPGVLSQAVVDREIARFLAAQLVVEEKAFRDFAKESDNPDFKPSPTKKGSEDRSRRKVVQGDLDKDGDADVAVSYKFESFGGCNVSREYLAVFVNDKGVLKPNAHTNLEAPGPSGGTVMLGSINKGVIVLDARLYKAGDSNGKPSGKDQLTYVLANDELKGGEGS